MQNTISFHNSNNCEELIRENFGYSGGIEYYSYEYIITGERWLQWIN